MLCAQSSPSLCDPMDCSPAGFSVREISQARILECAAISSSRRSSRPRDRTCVSCIGRQIICHQATWETTFVDQDGALGLPGPSLLQESK